MAWMYILKCADNSYYVGSTKNLELRLLCVYNSETTPPNNLECRAEEKMRCLRIQMVV